MVYRPSQALTVQNAAAVLDAGLRAIAEGQDHIDLSDLTAVDSAAVATMLAWQRAARAKGKSLAFSNLPANLQSLVELYDVAGLLQAKPHTSSQSGAAHSDLPHH
ncbi:MAG TPA: STAS domain-containing protein [Noviherbaspirillum sp.]|uniref:STAS domain-containing protein n=1 Tax=Noviherbaspirillum sp. TaxID=1926288 RepID=UPI002D275DEC|nr:STAS domain-containing protein [Noviherbaspirillum sp.]HYD94248.1 STAS domain-containing protein [Noviherbaspirillum sp.]